MKNEAVLENVRFERPMIEHIRDFGFNPVDMHFHTNHSDAYTKVRSSGSPQSRSRCPKVERIIFQLKRTPDFSLRSAAIGVSRRRMRPSVEALAGRNYGVSSTM